MHLNAEELREMVQSLRQTVTFKQATINKLTRFSAAQRSLLEETLDEDLQAVSEEMAQHSTAQN